MVQHPEFVEIIGLWVRPDYRGSSVSSDLVEFVRRTAMPGSDLRLAVMADNFYALRFYERAGFRASREESHPVAGVLIWMEDGGPIRA